MSESRSVELGVKFTADVDGTVDAVRFYKGPMNLGTHTGSVWSANGALLGTVTFTDESSTGWQTAYLTSPVPVTAGTTYIVSYRAPVGGFATTADGLSAKVDSPPLHAPANGGVFTYGAGAPLDISTANYWVDVVFSATDAAPSVQGTAPADGATNVPVGAVITATLSGQVQAGTPRLAVTGANGDTVPGTATFDPSTRVISFDPSSDLTAGETYAATVSGAVALSGAVMSPYTWTLTTADVSRCPCTLFDSSATPPLVDGGDGGSLELGVSFSSGSDGMITGVRFYKSERNTGTHVGNLWSATGTRLATGTFTGESATGWQTLTFRSPVPVEAGAVYVASYFAPNGHYSLASQFFGAQYSNGPLTVPTGNGLFRYGSTSGFPRDTYNGSNYWVDPIFKTGVAPDLSPPELSATTPADGATNQSVTSRPTATFTEDVNPSSLTFSLTSASGTPVGGSTAYDATTRTATFTPSASLAPGVVHSAAVTATDLSGNTMEAPATWSFTTGGVCPCTLWNDDATPATVSTSDSATVELGVEFSADVPGTVTAVRFYKGPFNTGTHTVSLWTTTGTRVATAEVTSETSAGWQTASFPAPAPVEAGTAYVVSYLAPNGRYSSTAGGLAAPVDNPPLHTPAGAGRYVYGGGYPAGVSNANYWVDPVFATSQSSDTTPPVISGLSVTGSGTTRTVTWSTDEPSTSSVAYGTTATSLTSTATGASGTSHSVTLTGLVSATTYHFRATSTDAADNAATSPSPPAPPATFETADVVAPTISGVAVSGTGATRTITWQTDEPSTSSVSYGTASTSLTSSATGASGTSHSVTLSGLAGTTTYYYRVASEDSAGNGVSFPAADAAPSSFTTQDTTAPSVSAVSAQGSGTSAVVTWTTDEPSTSSVAYGTSATSLTSSATGAGGTSHSVTLTGLTPNTRYHYRVTSVDPSGNSTTSPSSTSVAAQYEPNVAPVSITTAAEFSTGTGAYVSDTTGGEVLARLALGFELDGTTVPSGLTATTLVSGGVVTVANGSASVSGAQLATGTRSSGTTVSTSAALVAGQTIGWARTNGAASGVRAVFTMSSTGALRAVLSDSAGTRSTVIAGTWTDGAHEYRVDWTSAGVAFLVDGVQRYSSGFASGGPLRAVLVDALTGEAPLVSSWIRIGPYNASTTYLSQVLDAGATVGWDALSRDVVTPTGTGAAIQVRTGPTPTPGTGWTAWTTVPPATGSVLMSSRYLQYRVTLSTSGSRLVTPEVRSLTIAFHVL